MAKGKKPATYEDIEALPVGWVGEILEDELVASPRPAMGHAHTTSMLSAMLLNPFSLGSGGPGGWWMVYEPELHFGRNVLVPDLSGWRRERLPEPPSPDEPFMTLAPDWVCEVLSPSTRGIDRTRKLPIYHREGVAHAWLVEPRARTLEVFRREASGWLLTATHRDGDVVRAEPFDAVPLGLGALWLGGGGAQAERTP